MDPTNKHLGYPVKGYNDDECRTFPSRAAAARAIAEEHGCQERTADKEIRISIHRGVRYYGYYWDYINVQYK